MLVQEKISSSTLYVAPFHLFSLFSKIIGTMSQWDIYKLDICISLISRGCPFSQLFEQARQKKNIWEISFCMIWLIINRWHMMIPWRFNIATSPFPSTFKDIFHFYTFLHNQSKLTQNVFPNICYDYYIQMTSTQILYINNMSWKTNRIAWIDIDHFSFLNFFT